MNRSKRFEWIRKFVQEQCPTILQLEEEITHRTGQIGAEVVRLLIKYGWLDRKLKWHD